MRSGNRSWHPVSKPRQNIKGSWEASVEEILLLLRRDALTCSSETEHLVRNFRFFERSVLRQRQRRR